MHADLDQLLDDATSLIRFDTQNAPGAEAAAAEYVVERLRSLGAEAALQEVAPGRANALGRLVFGPGPVLMFNSHLDVVPVESSAQLTPRLENGRLYGRGACDAKGAVAAMLQAARALVQDRPGGGILVLAAVADEEVGGLGSRHLVGAGGVRADAAVVGEPTDNRINLGSRGALRVAVTFAGRAAHSSEPARGENAIYRAARFALAVESWHADIATRPVPAAVSTTVVAGGSKINIIPDSCTVQVDRRLAPGESVRDAERELKQVLEKLRSADPGLRWSIEPIGACKPSTALDAAHPFARLALDVVGGEGELFRGGTDAPYLGDAGIPSVILGPGSLDQAHTADEWVSTQALSDAADLYEQTARRFFAKP